MKRIYFTAALFISVSLFSCEKYVDDFVTKGSLTATGSATYRALLNNTIYFEPTASLPDYSSDDCLFADEIQQTALNSSNFYLKFVKSYTWADQYYDVNVADQDWNRLYTVISYCNTILDELPLRGDGTAEVKNELLAEALVHRADAYLQLINMYAKAYNVSTAATDLGVPLIIQLNFDQKLKRNSVQEVYDQIFKDLNTALPSLPASATFNTLPSKAAAYALLARANLFTGNYVGAKENAQNALAIKNTLNDYNVYINDRYPSKENDPEIIFSKTAFESSANNSQTIIRLNDELVDLWGPTDLRYQVLTRPAFFVNQFYTGRAFFKEIISGSIRNTGPCVPEMILINAEALARTGDAQGAINVLNQLRQKRFAPADYVPYTTATGDAALRLVLDERRRELFCHGSRWFDQKRLNNDPRFAKIQKRTFLKTNYTLQPGDNRYVYPIANYYFQFNPDWVQNPR